MRLFDQLAAERASGRVTTVHDWLREHPPSPDRLTQTLATVVARVQAGDPLLPAVRELLDEFAIRPTAESRTAAIEAEPPPTGDPRADAYLGALAEHLAAVHDLPRPAWCTDPSRFLDRWWFTSDVPGFRALLIAESPAAFRRRGIFVSAGSLERC